MDPLAQLLDTDEAGNATLLGSHCQECRRFDFPARQVCLSCGDRQLRQARLCGRGVVHESTTVTRPPAGFTSSYVVGLVDLEEGPRIFALLTSECPHGSRVHIVTKQLPSGDHGFAFEVDVG
jgi:uncharacterized OB-fold protein